MGAKDTIRAPRGSVGKLVNGQRALLLIALVGLVVVAWLAAERRASVGSATPENASVGGQSAPQVERELALAAEREVAVTSSRNAASVDAPGHTEVNLGRVVQMRVELDPAARITLRARSSDGRTLGDLATEIGLPSRAFLDGAYALRRKQAPDAPASAWVDRSTQRGIIELERSADEMVDPDADVVGVVRSDDLDDSWLGLALFAHVVDWKHVTGSERELVFTLSPDDLRETFATVSFRAIDARTREPLTTATARIETPDSLMHRSELNSLAVDERGRAAVPVCANGEYALSLTAPGYSEHRTHFALQGATPLDFGDIALELASPLAVRVTDRDGRPLSARVHVGPFEAGVAIQQLLSRRFVTTGENGLAHIAAPASIVVVRATVQPASPAGRVLSESKSRVVIVEPGQLPSTLEIVVYEPALVEVLRASDSPLESLRIETDTGIHLVTSTGPALLAYLQPDRYVVVGLDANDREVARRAFAVVESQRVSLTLP